MAQRNSRTPRPGGLIRRPLPYSRPPPPVQRTIVVQKASPKKNNGDLWEKVLSGIRGMSNRPELLVFIIVSFLIAFDVSHIDRLGEWLKSRSTTNAIGLWISENRLRVGGTIISFPAIYMFPTRNRVLAAFVVVLLLFILPPQDFYYYLVATLATVLYFQVPDSTVRMALIGFGILWFIASSGAVDPTQSSKPANNTVPKKNP